MTLGDFVNLMMVEQQRSVKAISEIEDALLKGGVDRALRLLRSYKKEHLHPRDLDRDVLEKCVRR